MCEGPFPPIINAPPATPFLQTFLHLCIHNTPPTPAIPPDIPPATLPAIFPAMPFLQPSHFCESTARVPLRVLTFTLARPSLAPCMSLPPYRTSSNYLLTSSDSLLPIDEGDGIF